MSHTSSSFFITKKRHITHPSSAKYTSLCNYFFSKTAPRGERREFKTKQHQSKRFKCIIFLCIFCNESLQLYTSHKQYSRWKKRERDDEMKHVLMLKSANEEKAHYCFQCLQLCITVTLVRNNKSKIVYGSIVVWHFQIKRNCR